MKELKKVDAFSCGKIQALFFIFIFIIIGIGGLVVGIISLFFEFFAGLTIIGVTLLVVVVGSIFYGLFGMIFGMLFSAIYNFLAKNFGGVLYD